MKLIKAATAFATLIRAVISEPDGLRVQENWEEMTPRLESGGPLPLPSFMREICLGFTGKDIGSVGIPGCTEAQQDSVVHVNSALNVYYTGPFKVEGSGAGIYGNQDQFHFFTGPDPLWDTDYVIEVTNFSDVRHQVGLMIRSSLDEGSRHFALLLNGDGTLVQATRSEDDGGTSFHIESADSTGIGRKRWCHWIWFFGWFHYCWFDISVLADVKAWVRIEKKLKTFRLGKSDYEFRSFYKLNESDHWIEVGGSKILKQWAVDDFMSGVAVTSNDNTELAVVNIPRVKVISFGTAEEALPSSTFELESCTLSARMLRLQLSSPVDDIEGFEFHATFAGVDAGESSGLNAIERHLVEPSDLSDMPMVLELDLGKSYPVDSVSIVGRECDDSNDRPGCLCQLSGATLSLVDDYGEDITSFDIGNDVCGKSTLEYALDASPEFCASSRLMHTTGDHSVPAPAPEQIQKHRVLGRRPRKC